MKYYLNSSRIRNLPLSLSIHARTIAILIAFMLCTTGSASAVIVPVGPHTFDANLPGNGFVSFDGTSLLTPVSPPTATLGVSIDSGALHQDYAITSFNIESGFKIASVFVFDVPMTGVIAIGDPIFGSIGPGMFNFMDGAGKIVTGAFTSGTLTSTVGASVASLSVSDINGLVLTPGPAFTFDTSSVTSILGSPTGFSISLSSIPGAGGVTATASGAPIGQFIPATLAAFGPSSGSAVVSGKMNVVPEPSTILLAGTGALLVLHRGWKRRRDSQVCHRFSSSGKIIKSRPIN
jgi:hypothetical protein